MNMDGRNIEVVEKNSFKKKDNIWSYEMPLQLMGQAVSQCNSLSY